MCPWVGPHAPSFGRQLWGLLSRVEYLSPQGVLLPFVYGTTASPLWFELRGHSAWQVTPSWTVHRLACHRLLPWLRVTFAMVPDAAWPGSDQWPWSTAPAIGPVGRLGRPSASDPWGIGSFLSLGRPTCVQFSGLLGSCSPVCPRGLLCCVCGVLGHLAPVHRCARSVCCVFFFLGLAVPCPRLLARCVVLRVRCPGPLGSRSPVCALCAVRACHGWLCPSSSPLNFRFFFERKGKTGARVHCRHRRGQLVRRCKSVVSSGVCRRCCGGGRAPGVRLARPDVHGLGSGWVW